MKIKRTVKQSAAGLVMLAATAPWTVPYWERAIAAIENTIALRDELADKNSCVPDS